MSAVLPYILAAGFALGLLILVHEFGHFLAAKFVGIRVERFSIGLPPRLFGKKIGETDYCVSAIPFGGYVKMAGMIDETNMDPDSIKNEPWEFQSKPVPHRVLTIFAGPFSNYILAILIYAGLIFSLGIAEPSDSTRVGEVLQGFPAEQAGIRSGDVIVAINGQPVSKWTDMTQLIHSRPDQDVVVEWEREGERFVDTLHTRAEKVVVDGKVKVVGQIGIGPAIERVREAGFFEALKLGFNRTNYMAGLVLTQIVALVQRKESIKSLGGPLLIAKLAGESLKLGFSSLLALTAFLSLNLALLNLLPFPPLDGGHLLFLMIEGVTRRPVPLKARVIVQQVGMATLLLLIIFIIYNDIQRVFFMR
jgi:regulator of sigma E protease